MNQSTRAATSMSLPQSPDGADPARLIMDLEEALQSLPQVEFPLAHFFAPGVCVRAILIREGVALTSKVHAKDHLCIMAGDMTIMTETETTRFTGFHVIESKAGDKRACFAHSDTFFATIHATDKTDPAEIEAEAIVSEPGLPN